MEKFQSFTRAIRKQTHCAVCTSKPWETDDACQPGKRRKVGLAANRQVVFVRTDEFEEELEVVVPDVGVDELFPLAIRDADVHLMRVQIDSAVELRGGCIILHTLIQ